MEDGKRLMECVQLSSYASPNRRRFDGTLNHVNQFGGGNRLLEKSKGTQLERLSFNQRSTECGDDNDWQFW